MPSFWITIPVVPVAQPRARARAFAGHAQVYQPKKHPVTKFKAAVRKAVAEEYIGPLLECPVEVDLLFVFPRPQRLIWKSKPMPREPHASKPDRDNLDKAILDALKGVLWRDDSQVWSGRIWKMIASGHEQAHIEMNVEW